jgi:hypothetical protein
VGYNYLRGAKRGIFLCLESVIFQVAAVHRTAMAIEVNRRYQLRLRGKRKRKSLPAVLRFRYGGIGENRDVVGAAQHLDGAHAFVGESR